MTRLYITHAHGANNVTRNSTFHHIIAVRNGMEDRPVDETARNEDSLVRQAPRLLTRRRVAIVCGLLLTACGGPPAAAAKRSRAGRVWTGLDILEMQKFAPLRGKHIGLITNHTGLNSQGRSNVELLTRSPGVHLVALFSPEHGLAGRYDEKVASS